MPKSILVTGTFNVLHPGHIRLFRFAQNVGNRLLVAVESDRIAGNKAIVPENLRLEGIKNYSLVDEAFIFDESLTELILRLRPSFLLKGREHELQTNPEKDAVESYGGKLIFSSGESGFSSSDLLRQEMGHPYPSTADMPSVFMRRHKITTNQLKNLVSQFNRLRVLTIGDLIVDDYIDCEPLGMSQEDTTLVVSPVEQKLFIGGAAIVSAHASGLGAQSSFISVVGNNEVTRFCSLELGGHGVQAFLFRDSSRPTTVKRRYRSNGKTLLRVSNLHQSSVSQEFQIKIIERARRLIKNIDLLVFSDFNYGVLTKNVVIEVTALARKYGVMTAADSQSSSQIGDICRFTSVDLILPTEREARVSTQNREDGLVVLAEQVRKKSRAKFVLLKLGADGVLIHAPGDGSGEFLTDQVEALNKNPKDVAGAGDSMLIATAMTIAVGGNIWEAACIGSIAAAIQVGRVGNTPLSQSCLIKLLDNSVLHC